MLTRLPLAGMLLAVLVLVVGGCSAGGDGSSASDREPTSAPSPSTPDEEPTAPEPADPEEAEGTEAQAEPSDVAFPDAVAGDTAAQQGILTLADLGGDWVELEPAGGDLTTAGGGTRIGCAFAPAAGADPASVTSIFDGPILQKGGASAYASSTFLAFQDEESAAAAVDALRSPAWSECRVATKDAQIPGGQDEETSWRADPLQDEGRGQGGYEGTVSFQYQALLDGEQVDANGLEMVSFYRLGHRVLVVATETVATESDAAELWQVFGDELHLATVAALGRIAG